MRTRPSSIVLVLVTATSLAACSGASPTTADQADQGTEESVQPTPEEPTRGEFIAEADDICLASARAIAANEKQYRVDTTEKQAIRIDEETARLATERLEALEAVEPPEELADDYERYLALRRQAVRLFDESNAARKKGDQRKGRRVSAEVGRLVKRLSEVGEDIGFHACANRLTKQEERKVKANVIDYFRDPGHRTCKKLLTKGLVSRVGGLQQCAELLLPSDKVVVREVEGVDTVRAIAFIVADAYDEQVEVTLDYEGGTYKIDGYQ